MVGGLLLVVSNFGHSYLQPDLKCAKCDHVIPAGFCWIISNVIICVYNIIRYFE